jgi:hypothetical protein
MNEEPFPGSPDDMMQTIADLRAQLEAARAERDALAISEARYASLQNRDECIDALRVELRDARAALRKLFDAYIGNYNPEGPYLDAEDDPLVIEMRAFLDALEGKAAP